MAPRRTYEIGKVQASPGLVALLAGARPIDELLILREELRGLEQIYWPASYQLKAAYDWALKQGYEPAPQPQNPFPGDLGRTYVMGAAMATLLRATREAYELASQGRAHVEIDPTYGTVVGVELEQLSGVAGSGVDSLFRSNLVPAFVRYAGQSVPLGFWGPAITAIARGLGFYAAGRGIASAANALLSPWSNKAEVERQKTYQLALKSGGVNALAIITKGNAATAAAEAQKPTLGSSFGTVLGLGVLAGLAALALKHKPDRAAGRSTALEITSSPKSP